MRLTAEEKDDIARLAREGKTYTEIAEWIGCARSTVTYHLRGKFRADEKRLKMRSYVANLRANDPAKYVEYLEHRRLAQKRYYDRNKEAAE